MDQLIPIAAKLQDVLGALGQKTQLDLPQIVVVGGQSSGKSSVLESIVGRSFLPRGTGIVTRRPLVLQLYNTSVIPPVEEDSEEGEGEEVAQDEQYNDEITENRGGGPPRIINTQNSSDLPSSGAEWGEFLHLPGRRFANFSDIRDEIIRDTERLTGRNRGISSTPLHLKIYSPRVLHLSLVDLPGTAKVAVGDQPHDIEDQIQDMCLSYISNPNAIILAVTAGNTDLANSDALKLARSVDPQGDRTIGVITKLDLLDPGTDCADYLQNRVIPLRRGYVGVVNRGQLDIDRDKSIVDGLKKEAQFFRSHPAYNHRALLAKCGTPNLARDLNGILMHHIRECLPELKSRITGMMGELQGELDALGQPVDTMNEATQSGQLLGLLSRFSANFAQCIDGRGTSIEGIEMNELYGGARVAFIFNEVFVRSLMSIDAFDGLSDEEIRTTICNANGTRSSLFVPEVSFDLLVRRQISRLEQPGLQCVDLVFDELQRIATQCEPPEFQRFPKLRERLLDVVSGLLKSCVGPTHMMVGNLVKIELAYINTSHPDFIGGSKAVARLMEKMNDDHQNATNGTADGGRDNSPGLRATSSLGDEVSLSSTPYPSNIENTNQVNTLNGGPTASSEKGGLMNFIFGAKKTNTGGPPRIVQLPQVPSIMRQTDHPTTDREKIETEIIKSLIESYFSIVRKNFIDMVPKTIMYFLVNHVRDTMQNELVADLYRDTMVSVLMEEADDIAQRRKTCDEMNGLLKKALEIVNEVRDFNTFST